MIKSDIYALFKKKIIFFFPIEKKQNFLWVALQVE